ncbi:MAG: choice-of-anchor Q domain-containing protein, partial [Planctomycetota bacterium]
DYKGKTVKVRSTDTDNWTVIENTVIDANGGNVAVTFDGNATFPALLQGFTVRGASRNGISCSSVSPAIYWCLIARNGSSSYDGGGMKNVSGRPRVVNCVFACNTGEHGGGMYNNDATPAVTNCVFYENVAGDNDGGGMCNVNGSAALITNCTFVLNDADSDGGGIFNDDSDPELCNCIFWDNTANHGNEVYNEGTADPIWCYSDIEGCGGSGGGWDPDCGTDCGGNIDEDPDFDDADDPACTDDIWGRCHEGLALDSGSPCIDAGDNNCNSYGASICGNDRIINGTIDMGAFEFDDY